MATCPQCGHDYQEGDRFCAQCGRNLVEQPSPADTTRVIPAVTEEASAALPDLTAEEEESVAALPTGSSLFLVRRGSDAGSRMLVDQDETTVGRNPGSDIFLDDVTVSRNHATFVRRGTDLVVNDLGSLNGTYVNRALIDQATVLRTGDEVQIGKFRLVYFASRHDMG